MNFFAATLAVLSISLKANTGICTPEADYKRGCYFTNWAQYRSDRGKYSTSDYVPGLCTHILYAFAAFHESSFESLSTDRTDIKSWSGGDGQYSLVNKLKDSDPQLKTLLSYGGATFGTHLFKKMSASEKSRSKFINSAIQFVRKHEFDGIDIDWECPEANDKNSFVLLFDELKAAISEEASSSGRPPLILSAAVPAATPSRIDKGYNIAKLARSIDLIWLMSYDFHGPWNSVTGHNSPLHGRPSEAEYLNTNFAAHYWNIKGMPKDKIVIGIATYGRGWTLSSPAKNELGAPATGPSPPQTYTKESAYAAYYELCEYLAEGAERHWITEQKVPYFVSNSLWFGYDDMESVETKMDWLKEEGYAGAFVWAMDLDDFNGQCSNGNGAKYPLLNAIKSKLTGGTVTAPPTISAPTTTGPSTNGPSTDGHTTPVQTTAGPASNAPTTAPGQKFQCTFEGLQADPTDCAAYYNCHNGAAHRFNCAAPLVWNNKLNYCDWGYNVNCKTGSTPAPTRAGPTTADPTTARPTEVAPPTTTQTPSGCNDFECGDDGVHQDPADCAKFYQCHSGIAYHFDCQPGLKFSTAISNCDWPSSAVCEETC